MFGIRQRASSPLFKAVVVSSRSWRFVDHSFSLLETAFFSTGGGPLFNRRF